MNYMVLFFTHSGAIKFDRMCRKKGIDCQLMPVPRSLSSNCSVSGHIVYDGEIEELIDQDIEKIFLIEDGENKLIYEVED